MWSRDRRTGASARGFTLIEIMIVITIIVLLGAIVGVSLFARRDEAKEGIALAQLQQIEQGLKQFKFDFERYPTDQEGVAVLWSKETLDQDLPQDKWKKYLDKAVPTDPWGQAWGYRQVSEHGDESTYDLWSPGKDKEEGTDDDITSWSKDAEGASGARGEMPPPGPSSSSKRGP